MIPVPEPIVSAFTWSEETEPTAAVKFWSVRVETAALRLVNTYPYVVERLEIGVEISCWRFLVQLLVLLVKAATVETGVDQSWRAPRLYW